VKENLRRRIFTTEGTEEHGERLVISILLVLILFIKNIYYDITVNWIDSPCLLIETL